MSHAERVAFMSDDMETLAGVTPESMATQVEAHASDIALRATAPGLKDTPLLVLTADDGLGPAADALVQAVRALGGHRITEQHVATNHVWSDSRIDLETRVIAWLQSLDGGRYQ
ncbi:MAG: hypothetical protein JSR67_14840 [Proteobacteria bacterium]|nr:hypothetical protein [Pseudomonadota bacterium]